MTAYFTARDVAHKNPLKFAAAKRTSAAYVLLRRPDNEPLPTHFLVLGGHKVKTRHRATSRCHKSHSASIRSFRRT
jgi:hypothetical protein